MGPLINSTSLSVWELYCMAEDCSLPTLTTYLVYEYSPFLSLFLLSLSVWGLHCWAEDLFPAASLIWHISWWWHSCLRGPEFQRQPDEVYGILHNNLLAMVEGQNLFHFTNSVDFNDFLLTIRFCTKLP